MIGTIPRRPPRSCWPTSGPPTIHGRITARRGPARPCIRRRRTCRHTFDPQDEAKVDGVEYCAISGHTAISGFGLQRVDEALRDLGFQACPQPGQG
jgi:hypothetical protein